MSQKGTHRAFKDWLLRAFDDVKIKKVTEICHDVYDEDTCKASYAPGSGTEAPMVTGVSGEVGKSNLLGEIHG